MNNSQNWLKTAEYLSISAAVVGTVAAEVTRQAVFASAPLSLALVLNLVNRRRADVKIQEQTDQEIGQLRRDVSEINGHFSANLETLRQRLLSLPNAPEPLSLSGSATLDSTPAPAAPLSATIAGELTTPEHPSDILANLMGTAQPAPRLSEQAWEATAHLLNTDSITGRLDELNNLMEDEFLEVRSAIAQLQTQLQTSPISPGTDLTPVQADLAQINQRLEQLPNREEIQAILSGWKPVENPALEEDPAFIFSAMRSLFERQNTLEQEIITAVRTELHDSLTPLKAIDATSLHDGFFQIQTEIAHLQRQLQEPQPTATADLSPLQEQLAQIHQRLDQQTPADLQEQLAQIHASLGQQPLGDMAHLDILPLEQRLEALGHAMFDWKQEMEALVQQSQGINLTSLQQQIDQIQQHLEQQSAPTISSQPLEQRIEALGHAMFDWKQEMEALVSQLPTVDLTTLQEQIHQINQRLDSLPPSFDPQPLTRQVETLSNTLTHWRQEAESSPLRQDLTMFFSAMRGLYDRNGTASGQPA